MVYKAKDSATKDKASKVAEGYGPEPVHKGLINWGASGYSGFSSTSGYFGHSGISGYSGFSCPPGIPGFSQAVVRLDQLIKISETLFANSRHLTKEEQKVLKDYWKSHYVKLLEDDSSSILYS